MTFEVLDLHVTGWYEFIYPDEDRIGIPSATDPTYQGFRDVVDQAARVEEVIGFHFFLEFSGQIETDVQNGAFDHYVGWHNRFYLAGWRVPFAKHFDKSFASYSQYLSFQKAMARRRLGTTPDFLLVRGSSTLFVPLYRSDHRLPLDSHERPLDSNVEAVWRSSGLSDPAMAHPA